MKQDNSAQMSADVHAALSWTAFWRETIRLHRAMQERRAAAAVLRADAPTDPALTGEPTAVAPDTNERGAAQ